MLLCGLALLGLLAACTRSPDEQAEVRIALLADFNTRGGLATVNTATLVARQINNAGGLDVGGRQHTVTLLIEDTKNMPGDALDAARRLINQQDVTAIVGPNISHSALAVAVVAENAGLPMISPGATSPEVTADKAYVFRVAFTDLLQGREMARFASEDLGAETAAVLYDAATAYNNTLANAFKETFEAGGGRVTAWESYITGTQDFGASLRRIQQSRAAVLFLPNYTDDVIAQAQQARRIGLEATFLSGDGVTAGALLAHPELDGAFLVHHWHVDLPETDTRARDFITAYRQAYQEIPNNMAPLTYDAFGVLFHAISRAGRLDPEAITEALSNIAGYPGITGGITYRGTHGDPVKNAVILQIREQSVRLYKRTGP